MSTQNFLWYLQVSQAAASAAAGLFLFLARLKQQELSCNKAPFMWLLSGKLVLSMTISIVGSTRAGVMPEVLTLVADALNITLLVFQIDKLQTDSGMKKAYHKTIPLAYLGSWAMMTLYDTLSVSELALSPQALVIWVIATVFRASLGLSLFVVSLWPAGDTSTPLDTHISDGMLSITNEIRAAGGRWLWMKKFVIFSPWICPSGILWEKVCAILAILVRIGEMQLEFRLPTLQSKLLESLQNIDDAMDALIPLISYQSAKFFNSQTGLSDFRRLLWKVFDLRRCEIVEVDMFTRIMHQSPAFHLSSNSTDTATASDLAMKVCRSLDFIIFDLVPHTVTIVGIITTIYSRYGAHVALIQWIASLLHIHISLRLSEILLPIFDAQTASQERTNRHRHDSFQGWMTIFVNGQIRQAIRKFATEAETQRKLAWRSWRYSTTFRFTAEFTLAVSQTIAMVSIFQSMNSEPKKHIGRVLAFSQYWLLLEFSQRFFFQLPDKMTKVLHDANRLRRILDTATALKYGTSELQINGGGIRFNDISFDHINLKGEKIPVFQGLNFEIEPGKTTALVGPSGAGKSTALNLLMRFYDPTKGTIEIDGQDIRNLRNGELSDNISFMEQTPYIFHDTFAANIGYGRPDACLSQIQDAAEMADIASVIERLPQQYDAMVGESGSTLSGGEKQRLALARVFLQEKRKILLFDEATSALDANTEDHVKESIKVVGANRTTVIVAHRLSSIRHANKIIVFGKSDGLGVIVQQGTHDELIKIRGAYLDLWNKHIGQV